MARIRTIKPDFMQSVSVQKLSREARLFFVQLLTEVDDRGRTKFTTRRLAGVLYPTDEDVDGAAIVRWTEECERAGLAGRYEVDGEVFLHVINFTKHQVISKPTKSKLPPAPWEQEAPVKTDDEQGKQEPSGSAPGARPETSTHTTEPFPESSGETLGNHGPEMEKEMEREREKESKYLAPTLIESDAPDLTPVRKSRKQDPLWDAVMAACSIDAGSITSSARGSYNRAVSDLRRVNALPSEVHERARIYRLRFRDAALTPTALAKHWAALRQDSMQAVPSSNDVALLSWAGRES